MNIAEALLKEHSKAQTLAVCDAILKSPYLFDELWELIKSGEPPIPQRAAWVLSHLGDMNPAILYPVFAEAVALLHAPRHDAVHRALVRTMSQLKIPEDYEGELYDLSIAWIGSPLKAVALRIFCMDIAAAIAMPYPELREEIRLVIESQMDWGSAGYKSRGTRVIKRLQKA